MQSLLKSIPSLLLIALTGLQIACTPLAEIKSFGAASKDVSTLTAACYTTFNTSLIQARRNTAILKQKPITPEVLRSPLEASFKFRVEMLSALGAYATALEALATKDTNPEIEKSATSFATNLNKLSASYEKSTSRSLGISPSEASILATGMKVAGNGFTEYKRKQAIRLVVKSTDPAIQKVCAYLPRELRSSGNTLSGFLQAEVNAYTQVLNATLATLPPDSAIAQGNSLQDVNNRQQVTVPLFNAAASAIEKIGETHAKLVEAVETKDFTTAEFSSKLSELIKYSNEVSDYYKTVKPTDATTP